MRELYEDRLRNLRSVELHKKADRILTEAAEVSKRLHTLLEAHDPYEERERNG